MIVFGTRGVTYTKISGEFHCPGCAEEQGYRWKRVRRFFTLYFIPVIPLDLLGEYIECRGCRSTFREEVLAYEPGKQQQAFQAEFEIAIRRVMVDMMMADGVIDEDEMKTLREVHESVVGKPLEEAELEEEISRAEREGTETLGYLKEVGAYLNPSGKELVIRAALAIAAADGEFQEEERQLLAGMTEALEMPPAHLRGVLAEMSGA